MSDNQSLGAAYYVQHVTIISVFSVIASVAVVLRIWARSIQKMSLELNDYLIVLGLLFALGESAVNIYGCCFGIVKMQSQKDIQRAIIFSQKAQFIGPIIWVASITLIRASIVFLYVRIFPTRLFRRICYLVLVINLVFFMGTILADCLICQPISYRWNRMTGGTGHCGHQKSLDLFIGIFNVILDVAVVVLPMPVLWGLKMAVGQKIMLSGMFGMGTVICAITLYRIYGTSTIVAANAQSSYALIALLTSLEALLGVINACLPVLKPIYNKMRGLVPKSGDGSGVREILKSGTIPIFMHMSQMWTLASGKGKHSSSDEETLTETSGWYGEKNDGKASAKGGKGAVVSTKEISPPMTKAERVMGISAPQIHVRKDVDVESVRLQIIGILNPLLVPPASTLDATLEHGILFISADHRLLYPSTAFDIITDVKNLFTFLASPDFSETHLPPGITLDASRIAVSGEAGGGYAARAAGIFSEPKPKALLLQYAQGGQLLDDHWLAVKDRNVPDPEGGIVAKESVAHLLNRPQEPISYDPIPFLGDDAPNGDSGRTKLLLWWWRTGGFVDVVLGVNGMSRFLRGLNLAQREGFIPETLRTAILQTQLTESFPPTFLLHGKKDEVVLPAESQLTYDRLQELGVEAELHLLEGAGHTLIDREDPPNLAAGAEEIQQKAVEFLVHKLKA